MKVKGALVTMMLLTIFLTQNSFAQVTIGAGLKPQHGALLDLKEHNTDAKNTTSTKGLLLPRVMLTSATDLFPMFVAGATNYTGATKVDEDAKHIGLLVFNVNPVPAQSLVAGMYVWDGVKWLAASLPATITAPAEPDYLGKMTGISGRTYKTRKFGKAGEWMIENLAETKYDTESPSYGSKKVIEGINPASNDFERYYTYPKGKKEIFTRHPEYGFLYSLVGATNGQVTEYEDDRRTPTTSRIQGLCPNGWRLPSNLDWDNLQAELEQNPETYSTSSQKGEVGTIAKSAKMVDGLSNSPTGGKSREDGLNAYLVGLVHNGQVDRYGFSTGFWTSSGYMHNSPYGFIRTLTAHSAKHEAVKIVFSSEMYSIRCIKGKAQ